MRNSENIQLMPSEQQLLEVNDIALQTHQADERLAEKGMPVSKELADELLESTMEHVAENLPKYREIAKRMARADGVIVFTPEANPAEVTAARSQG
jgi:NAD(P)H-dependent FMN reductase